eukprot:GFYU01007417.1.p1 GENE.GFYU01007417.1~~GFYU01007417.1.p1  ORF type:complete len:121 (+),score=26.99 GFYU01007417.1:256-618(+)
MDNVVLIGSNYPPTPAAALAAQLISYAVLAGMAIIFFGDVIFQTIGIPPPAFYKEYVQESKMHSFFVLMLINSLSAKLTETGAYEVYLNGELVHSRLDTGVIPGPHELLEQLSIHGLKFA